MDRLSQLRGEAGGSRDSTLDTTSPPSEGFMTANESSSKYYSLSEVDSTFDISSMKDDISSIKDVSLASTTTESEETMTNADELISNLSPIGKKSDILDSFKIDTQIEAANILSGGVAIFDDNDNSYDGNELVIDDNVEVDDKSNSDMKQPESLQFKTDENMIGSSLISEEADIASKDTEVVLQIDGKNVDAIDIGNGLYLYRKEGQEELAAVQIIDDDQQQPSFKFLKVRENAEGNLEVYEEIEIEVPKEVPAKEGKTADKNTSSHVPIKDINKVISDAACNKVAERKIKAPRKEPTSTTTVVELEDKETSPDSKSEVNLNGKMMKFSEARKSPVIGSFTPMTYHSTPNKEGIPLTKTMVDQQLHPNRHSDLSNVKKTIEVHTDSCKQKLVETPTKYTDIEDNKLNEISSTDKETVNVEVNDKDIILVVEKDSDVVNIKETSDVIAEPEKSDKNEPVEKSIDDIVVPKDTSELGKEIPMEQDSAIDSTEKVTKETEKIEIDPIDKDINEEIIIVEEVKHEEQIEEKVKENKLVIEDSLPIRNEKVEEVIQVSSEPDKGKEEPMELDDETALTIVETVTSVEESKDIVEDNIQHDEGKKSEIVEPKQDKVDVDEPILIEDDDVSIAQEVIEETKSDKVNIDENVSGSAIEAKSDVINKETAIELKNMADVPQDDTKTVNDNKDLKVKDPMQADSTSSNLVNEKDPGKHLVVGQEVQKDTKEIFSKIPTESKKYIETTLVVPNEPLKVATSTSPEEIVTKKINEQKPSQKDKDISIDEPDHAVQQIDVSNNESKEPIKLQKVNEETQKQVTRHRTSEDKQEQKTLPIVVSENKQNQEKVPEDKHTQAKVPENKHTQAKMSENKHSQATVPENKHSQATVPENKQNNKPIESLEIKVAADELTVKHVAPASISPLLEQKQQSLVAPKIIKDKSLVSDKIEIKKPSPSVQKVVTVNTVAEQKAESKVLEAPPKKTAFKVVHITESLPIITQMPGDDSNTPIAVPQIMIKEKGMHHVGSVEISKNIIIQPVKNTLDKPQSADTKRPSTSHRDEKKDIKLPSKAIASGCKGMMNIEICKVPKLETAKAVVIKQDVSSTSSKVTSQNIKIKNESRDKKELPRVVDSLPMNNNHAAVPFGKWTDANRQEFLSKFKTKASVTPANSNQLKNSNDLNRRDVLKKIDSQRQVSNAALSKTQEANKLNMKPETAAFSNKPTSIINKEVAQETKIPLKTEAVEVKPKAVVAPKNINQTDVLPKTQSEPAHTAPGNSASKNEVCQRTGVVQNLIDKTIEGMIHRSVPTPKTQDEPKQNATKESSAPKPTKTQQTYQPIEQATLDAIEMKMNELHGIPFIERPPHELPQVPKSEPKSYSKSDKEKPAVPIKAKIPNLLPFPNKNQPKLAKESVIEVDSEDEIIEHEPITGDIDLSNKNQVVKPLTKEKSTNIIPPPIQPEKLITDAAKKEAIITEKDFDKFARRNSITYENCLTVNFDGKEPHNVIQTVVEKDPIPKVYSRNDTGRIDSKTKLPYKYQNVRPNTQPTKLQPVNKFGPANDDASNRNQSKLQKAYHSALTAKRQLATECPITIIEDKPVKVVFMDSVDYVPSQLNVQGQDLSPVKRAMPESDITVSTCDSLDSDLLDSMEDVKSQEEVKTKTKHQRKQVLTPVDEPELELIEPRDLGIEISPKKKRKTDDDKTDKNLKYPMRKKFYLLGSSAVTEEKVTNSVEILKNPLKETVNLNDNGVAHKNPVSALDSLVKAAELIETQTENINSSITSISDSQSNTPVKRGRGRPRKYPLTPDGTVDKSKVATPSPQKKPRLIDAKKPKRDTFTDESDTDDEIIKENWTMGKINENIVCPICNKLFRTENVVFKHVKHCTGPSPSRSDSDKRSPRRMRISQDFDTKSRESKSDDMDIDDDKPLIVRKESPKKRKSKDSVSKSDDKDEIIVIEDTPIKEKPEKVDERKHHESRKSRTKIPHKSNDLVCEFCGKTFRQLSYLVSHKLQHKKAEKAEPKKTEKDAPVAIKSVYSCEVCKKEFRKLHHLVQHRIIHNPSSVPGRSSRKSSSEQSESKLDRESTTSKQSEDPSAGFRCEPCDKSFRKLHHLVEHRETHDGINRQKTTTAPPSKEEKPVEKPVVLYQCDVCRKTFRKLQHLNEHKEQHVETSSDKSDDKSVKSSLSTRDIIHECSLCYMVFPNEHSLTKHTIICQRKKKSKQLKPADETAGGDEVTGSPPPEEKNENVDIPKPIFENTTNDEDNKAAVDNVEVAEDKPPIKEPEVPKEKPVEPVKVVEKEKVSHKLEPKPVVEQQVLPAKRDFVETETGKTAAKLEVPEKIKNVQEKEPIKIRETPKKKTPLKEKTATKRLKTAATPTPVPEVVKPAAESSDEDDVRYMLNPNFKAEEVTEEKVFMKVRAKKRSSLQIERPNSKDLMKRRTSLQHPPKIPRLKPRAVETNPATVKKEVKTPKVEPVPSTDSDDSETTKYSFPSTIPEKPPKPAQDRTPKESERKILKRSLVDKRKSLNAIAKRKSLGKSATARHKVTPLKQAKKRTLDAEHRCDCGQLFSSAALLSRHTTLAHTPPRIRRRRSPPPEEKPIIKPAPRKSSAAEKPKQAPASRKSSARSDSSTSANTKSTKSEAKGRRSTVKDIESPSDAKKAKPEKSEAISSVKPRRTGAHRGVPVPEKMRKLMHKNK